MRGVVTDPSRPILCRARSSFVGRVRSSFVGRAGPEGAFESGQESEARRKLFNRIAPVYDDVSYPCILVHKSCKPSWWLLLSLIYGIHIWYNHIRCNTSLNPSFNSCMAHSSTIAFLLDNIGFGSNLLLSGVELG